MTTAIGDMIAHFIRERDADKAVKANLVSQLHGLGNKLKTARAEVKKAYGMANDLRDRAEKLKATQDIHETRIKRLVGRLQEVAATASRVNDRIGQLEEAGKAAVGQADGDDTLILTDRKAQEIESHKLPTGPPPILKYTTSSVIRKERAEHKRNAAVAKLVDDLNDLRASAEYKDSCIEDLQKSFDNTARDLARVSGLRDGLQKTVFKLEEQKPHPAGSTRAVPGRSHPQPGGHAIMTGRDADLALLMKVRPGVMNVVDWEAGTIEYREWEEQK